MQKSGFFNAIITDNDYDRKYNANDYCDNLAVVISNGVLRSINDDLKVTASGLTVSVGVGRAWINGHYYYNDSAVTYTVPTPPTGGSRIDRIILRLNKNVSARSVELVYATGTAAASPVAPALTRTENIYDLCLANISVSTNATTVGITDTRGNASVCGWVYSVSGDQAFLRSIDSSFNEWFQAARNTLASVTLFKRYVYTQTLAAQGSSVSFNIPQYDADTCFLEVYVNGILDRGYTLSNNVITFDGTLVAGTLVTVYCYKSIDGTGIQSVSDEITQLQNQYATLAGISKFTYKCTGLNDNVSLSEIAQAFINGSYTAGSLSAAAEAFLTAIGGNAYLATLSADTQVTIDVTGVLGATTPVGGSGTAASRYRWFALGAAGSSDKRIIFNFAKCHKINIACAANTDNIIFYGTDLNIKNANVYAGSNGANCVITMNVGSNNRGNMNFDSCRFKIVTTGKAVIANNGNFTNCVLHVKSATDNAYCIDAKSDSLVRLDGGNYYAYTGTSSKTSSVTNVESTETNAVIMAHNINCPIVAQTGYYQKYFIITNAGMTYIAGVCTTLTGNGSASYRSLTGKIEINKR